MSALLSLFLDVTVSLPNASFTKVRRYTLADRLNTIPELVIEILCDDPALDLSALVGETAVVFLDQPLLPRFDGIVRAVEQLSAEATGVSCYALTIAPAFWLTTERSAHRIYRRKTTFGILSRVLANYDHRIAEPELRLTRAVTDWTEYDYRVQYGETDSDLVFRLLSEEGLASYWGPSVDDPQKRVWTLTDDTSAGDVTIEVPFRPPSSAMASADPHVQAVSLKARLAPSEVKLRDYDYGKPLFKLESRCFAGDSLSPEAPLVRYGYAVGAFEDDAGGIRLAETRLQAARAKSRTYRWETSFAAPAGARLRLHDHPRDDANGDFLVVAMRTLVEPNRRTHVAELVPAAFPWRPEPRAKPRVHGTQTAFVVGAPGKEIDVDELGRVEVEFRWDTRDLHGTGASRRVRVGTPWAGADRGFWAAPRVGDEVVIAYLDGDPDQPLVVGSVNNAVAPPAVKPSKHQTQSWWKSRSTANGTGYNAIFMDDLAGHELLALRAEKDFICEATNNSMTKVGGGASVSIVKGQSIEVGEDLKTTVSGKFELHAAQVELNAKGDINFNANGARNDSAETFHYISSPFIYMVGRDTIEAQAQTKIVLKVGGSSITIESDKITLTSPLIELNP